MIIRNSLLVLLLVMLFFSGCRSFEKYARTNFYPPEISPKIKASIHLPALKNRVFEQDSFMITAKTAKFLVSQDLYEGATTDSGSYVLDIYPMRFYEIVKVISGALPEYKPNTKITFTGYPKFTILEYEENSSLGLKLLTAFTLGIPCLLGIPANSVSTYVKIQTEWMDDSGKIILSEISQGYNKTFIAMYWGYGADARKRSNMLAMQKALRNSQH